MLRTKLFVHLIVFLCYFYESNSSYDATFSVSIPTPTDLIHKVKHKVSNWVGDVKNFTRGVGRRIDNLVNVTFSGSMPDIDVNWPGFNVTLPDVNITGPNINITAPNFNITAPNFNITGPNVNITGPNINISGPNYNLSNPSSNITWPDYQWPNVNANITGPKIQTVYSTVTTTQYVTLMNANTVLNTRLTNLQTVMGRCQQKINQNYNTSSEPYYYMMSFLNRITVTEIQMVVINLNYALVPYNRMVDVHDLTGTPCKYVFPTMVDADGVRHSFPNGFSLQSGDMINANGVPVGEAPVYQPVAGSGGTQLATPDGQTYNLAPCYKITQDGCLRHRLTNQPVALPQEYMVDIGGITYLQGGTILGTLSSSVPISGSFSPQSTIRIN